MFSSPFALPARANRLSRAGVNKFTFCDVIDTDPKLPSGPVKSTVFRRQRFKPCIFEVQGFSPRRPAAVDYLASLLCTWLALALLATGCAGPRPLKGGRGVTTRNPAGAIEQTLVQGENPSQASKQDQESVKLRTYTVPAGSRIEQSPADAVSGGGQSTLNSLPRRNDAKAGHPSTPRNPQPSTLNAQPINLPEPSTLNAQPSTTFVLSAPMPVVEREETKARTELGAAQKDTARELGAKLSSLKGIVWVGVGLFVFGLASLVYPPLKVVVASVTTSAALMLGGVALMVLPSMIVGNELLILGLVAVGVGGWFLAHRHGQLRGTVAASTATTTATTPQPRPRPPGQWFLITFHVSRFKHPVSRFTFHAS